MKPFSLAAIAMLSTALACRPKPTTEKADHVYYGGDIITMETDSAIYVEALAVKDGRILFSGTRSGADSLKGDSTQYINLSGKTLLPGFIDGHSHFINALTLSNQANCSYPPVGEASDVAGIIRSLEQFAATQKIPDDGWLIGYGYDDTQMPGKRLLNRDDLDSAFPHQPVIVIHVSLHGAVLNSKALQQFGLTAQTPTPPGGIIVRKPGTREPWGLIMETAFLPIFAALPKPNSQQLLQQVKDGQLLYAAAGVTTAQEGASHIGDIALFKQAADSQAFFIDLISYPLITDAAAVLAKYPPSTFGRYENRLKLGGIKITIDGSPQGRTAFFSTPYLTGGPGGERQWQGEPTFPQDSLNAWMKKFYSEGLQVIVHGNGDAAIDMILKANALARPAAVKTDLRTVIIHAQFARIDQLDRMAAGKIIPSFFSEHTYFFGDAHIANRGLEQASGISPLHSAIRLGLHPTNHTDFSVLPINQLMTVWSAVNRTTRNDVSLGERERISPYQALKCITDWGAYVYFEENDKGTLTKGKRADLVVLDRNPLKIPAVLIKDIQVLETIKDGKSIYRKL